MERIKLEQRVLNRNDEIAARLRSRLSEQGIYTLNLISSPGSGKTSLLEVIIPKLQNQFSCGVLEGDIQTENDARRVARTGVPVHQIITCGTCHLDAQMVADHLEALPLNDLDILFIENVGNLVCPSSYNLGEDVKVVILSVPEGDDKPLKYPAVFRRSAAMVINKIDLLGLSDFDMTRATHFATGINPDLAVFPLSCRTGEGISAFMDWISTQAKFKQEKG